MPEWLPKWVPRWLQIDSRWAILANKSHGLSLPELSKKLLFLKWLQDGSRWPRETQDNLSGAFLGLQKLSWKALDPQKPEKTMVFQCFVNAGFRYFEVLGGPLGPILAPLGPIWSQKGFQNRSLDGSKMGHLGCHQPRANPAGALLEALVSKIAPRWVKMAPHSPR